jgi:hypothetical protein
MIRLTFFLKPDDPELLTHILLQVESDTDSRIKHQLIRDCYNIVWLQDMTGYIWRKINAQIKGVCTLSRKGVLWYRSRIDAILCHDTWVHRFSTPTHIFLDYDHTVSFSAHGTISPRESWSMHLLLCCYQMDLNAGATEKEHPKEHMKDERAFWEMFSSTG